MESVSGTMASTRSDIRQVISWLDLSAGTWGGTGFSEAYVSDRNSKRHNPKQASEPCVNQEQGSCRPLYGKNTSLSSALNMSDPLPSVTPSNDVFLQAIWFHWARPV